MENTELQHHGTKGMRWGVRRYQNKDGSLTADGKKRYGLIGTIKEHSAQKKRKKQQLKNLEKAREAAKTKREEAAEKKRVLESGTATEVMKYKGKLTNQELNNVYNRLNYERMLSEISGKEIEAGKHKISGLVSKIDNAMDTATKGLGAYNKAAKLVNAVTKVDLPTFEGNKKTKAAESALEKLVKSGSSEQVNANLGKFTSKQLQDINTRFTIEDKVKERAAKDKSDKESAARLAEAQRQVDEYNKRWLAGESSDSVRSTEYSKSGKDIIDSRLDTNVGVSSARDSKATSSGHNYISDLFEDK